MRGKIDLFWKSPSYDEEVLRRIFYKYFKIILLMESFVFNILLGAVFESMNDKFVSDPTLVFKRIQSREVKLSKMLRSIGGLVS